MDQFAKEGKGGNVLSPLIKTPAASREHILSYILYSTYSKSFFSWAGYTLHVEEQFVFFPFSRLPK